MTCWTSMGSVVAETKLGVLLGDSRCKLIVEHGGKQKVKEPTEVDMSLAKESAAQGVRRGVTC